MTNDEFVKIEQGDGLIVAFGRFGNQVATALGWTRSGNLYAAKWRDRSKKWTGRVRVSASEIKQRSYNFQHEGLPVGPVPELRRGLLRTKP